MSINHHKLYLDNVFALAGTLVIKSEYSAECINNRLISLYGAAAVDMSQPQTWKYYLNICGEYHPTDPVIEVRSLDTLQMIPFTKTNLLTHTATARAYRYGSRYYRELVSQYPAYESLILGVLYPAKMSQALTAPDMSVLAYPDYLVEENEETLIRDINNWLDKFTHRWFVSGFLVSDELYGAAFLGHVYAQLVPLILTLRLRACRTPHVHSYHVRQYLASHGMLDSYLMHLTRKQALFFYRNMMYIERHGGKASTFDWLVEKVMTDRGLPLVEYEMRHNTTHMLADLSPQVVFTTTPLNNIVSKSNTQISTSALLAKEVPDAVGNLDYVTQNSHAVEDKLRYSLHALAKTKVLESSLVQNSDNSAHSVQDTALSMWGYYAATGKYPVYTRIKNPVSGEEITLSMLQAYYYFFYAFCMVHSVKLQTVPPIYSQAIPRTPLPTLAEVMDHVDTKYVDEATVVELMSKSPPPLNFVNTDMFKDGVETVFDAINEQSMLVAKEEHYYARGLLHSAYVMLYSDYLIRNADTGQNIITYFESLDIPTSGFTDLEWQQIYLDLFQSCTGYDMQATIQASDMQKAMIRLMTQLSSYSIQFVSELTGSSIRSFNWAAVRLGDNSGASRSYFELIIGMLDWFSHKSNVKMYLPVPVLATDVDFRIKGKPQYLGLHEVPVDIKPDAQQTAARHEVILDMGTVDFDDRFDPNVPTTIPSWEVFETLTNDELGQIKDIYSSRCRETPVIPDKLPLAAVVRQTELSSFETQSRPSIILPSWKAYWGPRNMRYFYDENFVIVLNGIWYFGGENRIDNFIPTIGHSKVKSFKYITGTEHAATVPEFVYSGGILRSLTFEAGAAQGDVVIGSFKYPVPEIEASFNADIKVHTLTPAENVTRIVDDIRLGQLFNIYQFSLVHKAPTYNIGTLKNVTKTPRLAFKGMAHRLVLTPFERVSAIRVASTFTADVNVYHLLPLFQVFVSDGPTLKGWGNVDVDGVQAITPDNHINDSGTIELTSAVGLQNVAINNQGVRALDMAMPTYTSVQELGFSSGVREASVPALPSPRVIHILDFEAVMNTLPPPTP